MRFPTAAMIPLLAALAAISASCAYVMHGKTEEITVESNPPGAEVTLSNGMTGVTPFTITVPRERDLVFHFSKDGYQPADVYNDAQVESKYIAADWASMLLTAIPIAWISDVSSGSAHTHEKTLVAVTLVRDPSYGVHPASPAAAAQVPVPRPSAAPPPTPEPPAEEAEPEQ